MGELAERTFFKNASKIIDACHGASGSGRYSASTPNEIEGITLQFTECTCGNGTEAGEITTTGLVGVLGVWKKETEEKKNKIGIDLRPASGETLYEATCPGEIKTESQRGSVIAQENTTNSMTTFTRQKFTSEGGTEKPQHFLAGEPATALLEAAIGGGPWEEVGWVSPMTQTTAIEVELRAGIN